jgi:hypothetical protein
VSARKIAGRALLVIGSIAVAVVAAEILFRVRLAADDAPDGDDGGWRERYTRMNETLYRRSDDPELVYEPVPRGLVEMEYRTAAFNLRACATIASTRETEWSRHPDRRLIVWSEFVALEQSLGRTLGTHHRRA